MVFVVFGQPVKRNNTIRLGKQFPPAFPFDRDLAEKMLGA
jgi:hypothetical protein